MLRSVIIIGAATWVTFFVTAAVGRGSDAPVRVCDRFAFSDPGAVSLTDVEKRMICGDPKLDAWKDIPDSQAIFTLRSFLQTRGYFDPKFQQKGGTIFVDTGPASYVAEFRTEGAPAELDVAKLRHIEGERLTPRLLDEVRERLVGKLRSMGYPCPTVRMEAGYATGELVARVSPGRREKLVRVDEDRIEGVKPGMMSRYHAFEIGNWYDADMLAVTRQRILDDAIVQGNYFNTECADEGALVTHRFVPGPPRLVSVGLGVDTERGPIVRASWKNSRLWETASILEARVNASFREQEIVGSATWFPLSTPSRYFLRPILSVKRENETAYEDYVAGFQGAIGTSWDSQRVGARGSIGPKVNLVRTVRGAGIPSSEFLTLAAEGRLVDHEFELYRGAPREGFDVRMTAEFSRAGWASPFDGQLFRVNFQKLWNFLDLDPPFLVLGLRGALGLTLTHRETVEGRRVPASFTHFLGGSETLRGFGRKSLPASGTGALTALYLGAEARLADVLPLGLQPFVFADFGKLGARTLAFDSPLYWSPGLGVRWQTQIGVIRATFARGIVSGERLAQEASGGWQFYFSFGEEF